MSLRDEISRRLAQFQHLRMGCPEHAIFFGAGLGDDLLCATVARELKQRGARRIVMFSQYASLFEGNPDVAAVYDYRYPTVGRLRHWGYSCIVPQYARYDAATDRDVTPRAHFLEIMCRQAGMLGEIELRPYFYLTAAEKEKGRLAPAQAVIHSAGRAAMKNKQWAPERYQAVAEALKEKVTWIQLGTANDPPINGAIDLRGRTTLRESAAIVANARVLLGEAGFLMHLARAVETRAVIVYGGREDPAVSGYRAHENIVGRTPCSPCWQRTRCDFGHECMRMISVEEVAAAVQQQIDRYGTPLETERASLDGPMREAA